MLVVFVICCLYLLFTLAWWLIVVCVGLFICGWYLL